MQLYTVGINHTTAPIAIREKVAFDPDHLSQALRDLMDNKVNEAAKHVIRMKICLGLIK